jgi:hypothetical protein
MIATANLLSDLSGDQQVYFKHALIYKTDCLAFSTLLINKIFALYLLPAGSFFNRCSTY